MKKIFLSLILVLGLAISSNAQSKKTWVGGSVSVNVMKPKNFESTTNFSIFPEIGHMFSDNLGLGVQLGYGHQKEFIDNLGAYKLNSFSIKPFARYLFLRRELTNLFIDGGVGYTNTSNNKFDIKTHSFEVGLRPGVMLNLSEKIALTGKFGFLGYRHDKTEDFYNNSFNLALNLNQIELGMNFNF